MDEACSHSLGWLEGIKDPVFLQEHTIIEKSLILVCVCDKNGLQCRWSLREVNVQAQTQGGCWLREGSGCY